MNKILPILLTCLTTSLFSQELPYKADLEKGPYGVSYLKMGKSDNILIKKKGSKLLTLDSQEGNTRTIAIDNHSGGSVTVINNKDDKINQLMLTVIDSNNHEILFTDYTADGKWDYKVNFNLKITYIRCKQEWGILDGKKKIISTKSKKYEAIKRNNFWYPGKEIKNITNGSN